MSIYKKDIVVIDIESTGTLERTKPTKITQIGMVKLDKDTGFFPATLEEIEFENDM